MAVEFTDEQKAVIDARKCNILVSAAAGSGKTAVLVERIIQMIKSDLDIDHLLVVTFTKAAASQMREKITLAIQNCLVEDPDNKHLQKQETLIHNAQITTIDSFCQYIVKNNFNTIGIDPAFRVGDEGELALLKEEIMQELLEDEYQKAKEGDNEDFLFCMNYFGTGNDDKNVESYISQIYDFAMSMPWPEDWINERARDYEVGDKAFEELDWVQSCITLARGLIKEMVSKLEKAEKICCEPDGPYMYGELLEKEKSSIEALLRYDTYDALFDGLRTISFDTLPRKKDDSVSQDKRESAKKLRDDVKATKGKLLENYFALPSGTVLDQMKLCDRAVKELCRLAIRYKEMFDAKKREKQLIDFSDMEHFALQILVNHPDKEECEGFTAWEILDKCSPSAVALEYRDYYREVLIDEYQDSNNVQELILKSISGETAGVSERFMVGDVKQSIYKFRLARPEIFMEKLGTYDKAEGAADRRIDLHKNFRSRKEVLDATNYIFEKIMGGDLGSVEYDEDARLVCGAKYEEPLMDVSPELILFDSKSEDLSSKEKEALVIAERIHALMEENKALKFKDIVILLRSLSGWDDVFKKVLEEQQIPTYIESKSGYFDAIEIAVMLNLLTVIDNPSQDIPLVSVMHSFVGGFDDEELAKLRIAVSENNLDDNGASFYKALKELSERGLGTDKLKNFVEFIEELREMSVYTPVHEILQHIIDKTGYDNYLLAMPGGVQRKANLDQLLSRALSFEKTSFKGLFHFVRYIEHMRTVEADYGEAGIIDENADIVRIMSIHKSKGLEFPVVFVAGMSKGFNLKDTTGDLIVDMDLGIGVRCIDFENRVKYDTLKRVIIADKMKNDCLGEELRILYVALTRAKEKLIMTSAVKKLSDNLNAVYEKLPVLAGKELLLPYTDRSTAKSYYDLVIEALVRHPGFRKALEDLEIHADKYKEYSDSLENVPSFTFTALTDENIEAARLKRDVEGILRKKDFEDCCEEFDEELSGRLKAKFESRYAFEHLKGLFTKTTVTELKKHMLEEMGEDFSNTASYAEWTPGTESEGQNDEEKWTPGTESQGQNDVMRLTGAERGTAYHRIMEILDRDIYGDEKLMESALAFDPKDPMTGGFDEVSKKIFGWLGKQVTKGMIPEEYKDCMWTPDVTTFLSTDLGQRMGKAFRRDELMREKPFMMGIPASELNEAFPSEEMVLIQGIIDAWFIEDGEIVLMDYKTDRVKEGQELIDRYRIQLDYYKRALEATTHMKVKEVYIYSFGLGEVIKL